MTLTSAVPIVKLGYSVNQIAARLNKAKPQNCHADLFQKQSWNLYAEGQILSYQNPLSTLRSSLLPVSVLYLTALPFFRLGTGSGESALVWTSTLTVEFPNKKLWEGMTGSGDDKLAHNE